jgi:hypothetical protein
VIGWLAALVALAGPAVSHATMAVPDGLPVGSIIVYSQSGFIINDLPLQVEFDVPLAGTLHVQLLDVGLTAPFESLSFLLTSGSSVLADLGAPQTLSFELSSPGRLFGFINGDPQEVGAYLLQVSITPVPLPAAALLLLSGLAGFVPLIRHRRSES